MSGSQFRGSTLRTVNWPSGGQAPPRPSSASRVRPSTSGGHLASVRQTLPTTQPLPPQSPSTSRRIPEKPARNPLATSLSSLPPDSGFGNSAPPTARSVRSSSATPRATAGTPRQPISQPLPRPPSARSMSPSPSFHGGFGGGPQARSSGPQPPASSSGLPSGSILLTPNRDGSYMIVNNSFDAEPQDSYAYGGQSPYDTYRSAADSVMPPYQQQHYGVDQQQQQQFLPAYGDRFPMAGGRVHESAVELGLDPSSIDPTTLQILNKLDSLHRPMGMVPPAATSTLGSGFPPLMPAPPMFAGGHMPMQWGMYQQQQQQQAFPSMYDHQYPPSLQPEDFASDPPLEDYQAPSPLKPETQVQPKIEPQSAAGPSLQCFLPEPITKQLVFAFSEILDSMVWFLGAANEPPAPVQASKSDDGAIPGKPGGLKAMLAAALGGGESAVPGTPATDEQDESLRLTFGDVMKKALLLKFSMRKIEQEQATEALAKIPGALPKFKQIAGKVAAVSQITKEMQWNATGNTELLKILMEDEPKGNDVDPAVQNSLREKFGQIKEAHVLIGQLQDLVKQSRKGEDMQGLSDTLDSMTELTSFFSKIHDTVEEKKRKERTQKLTGKWKADLVANMQSLIEKKTKERAVVIDSSAAAKIRALIAQASAKRAILSRITKIAENEKLAEIDRESQELLSFLNEFANFQAEDGKKSLLSVKSEILVRVEKLGKKIQDTSESIQRDVSPAGPSALMSLKPAWSTTKLDKPSAEKLTPALDSLFDMSSFLWEVGVAMGSLKREDLQSMNLAEKAEAKKAAEKKLDVLRNVVKVAEKGVNLRKQMEKRKKLDEVVARMNKVAAKIRTKHSDLASSVALDPQMDAMIAFLQDFSTFSAYDTEDDSVDASKKQKARVLRAQIEGVARTIALAVDRLTDQKLAKAKSGLLARLQDPNDFSEFESLLGCVGDAMSALDASSTSQTPESIQSKNSVSASLVKDTQKKTKQFRSAVRKMKVIKNAVQALLALAKAFGEMKYEGPAEELPSSASKFQQKSKKFGKKGQQQKQSQTAAPQRPPPTAQAVGKAVETCATALSEFVESLSLGSVSDVSAEKAKALEAVESLAHKLQERTDSKHPETELGLHEAHDAVTWLTEIVDSVVYLHVDASYNVDEDLVLSPVLTKTQVAVQSAAKSVEDRLAANAMREKQELVDRALGKLSGAKSKLKERIAAKMSGQQQEDEQGKPDENIAEFLTDLIGKQGFYEKHNAMDYISLGGKKAFGTTKGMLEEIIKLKAKKGLENEDDFFANLEVAMKAVAEEEREELKKQKERKIRKISSGDYIKRVREIRSHAYKISRISTRLFPPTAQPISQPPPLPSASQARSQKGNMFSALQSRSSQPLPASDDKQLKLTAVEVELKSELENLAEKLHEFADVEARKATSVAKSGVAGPSLLKTRRSLKSSIAAAFGSSEEDPTQNEEVEEALTDPVAFHARHEKARTSLMKRINACTEKIQKLLASQEESAAADLLGGGGMFGDLMGAAGSAFGLIGSLSSNSKSPSSSMRNPQPQPQPSQQLSSSQLEANSDRLENLDRLLQALGDTSECLSLGADEDGEWLAEFQAEQKEIDDLQTSLDQSAQPAPVEVTEESPQPEEEDEDISEMVESSSQEDFNPSIETIERPSPSKNTAVELEARRMRQQQKTRLGMDQKESAVMLGGGSGSKRRPQHMDAQTRADVRASREESRRLKKLESEKEEKLKIEEARKMAAYRAKAAKETLVKMQKIKNMTQANATVCDVIASVRDSTAKLRVSKVPTLVKETNLSALVRQIDALVAILGQFSEFEQKALNGLTSKVKTADTLTIGQVYQQEMTFSDQILGTIELLANSVVSTYHALKSVVEMEPGFLKDVLLIIGHLTDIVGFLGMLNECMVELKNTSGETQETFSIGQLKKGLASTDALKTAETKLRKSTKLKVYAGTVESLKLILENMKKEVIPNCSLVQAKSSAIITPPPSLLTTDLTALSDLISDFCHFGTKKSASLSISIQSKFMKSKLLNHLAKCLQTLLGVSNGVQSVAGSAEELGAPLDVLAQVEACLNRAFEAISTLKSPSSTTSQPATATAADLSDSIPSLLTSVRASIARGQNFARSFARYLLVRDSQDRLRKHLVAFLGGDLEFLSSVPNVKVEVEKGVENVVKCLKEYCLEIGDSPDRELSPTADTIVKSIANACADALTTLTLVSKLARKPEDVASVQPDMDQIRQTITALCATLANRKLVVGAAATDSALSSSSSSSVASSVPPTAEDLAQKESNFERHLSFFDHATDVLSQLLPEIRELNIPLVQSSQSLLSELAVPRAPPKRVYSKRGGETLDSNVYSLVVFLESFGDDLCKEAWADLPNHHRDCEILSSKYPSLLSLAHKILTSMTATAQSTVLHSQDARLSIVQDLLNASFAGSPPPHIPLTVGLTADHPARTLMQMQQRMKNILDVLDDRMKPQK